jgi:hypothetical protein
LCFVRVMACWPSRPSIGAARRKRGEDPPSVDRVEARPPGRWANADRNPALAPQSKPVTPASRLVARSAVGGILAWAENPGHRASHLPTLLLLRPLWAPIPKFIAECHEQGRFARGGCPIRQIRRSHALRRHRQDVGSSSGPAASLLVAARAQEGDCGRSELRRCG